MLPLTFEPGACVNFFKIDYIIVELIDDKEITLRTADGGDTRKLTLDVLLEHYCNGHVRPGARQAVPRTVHSVALTTTVLSPASIASGTRWLKLIILMQNHGLEPKDIHSTHRAIFLKCCIDAGFPNPPHRTSVTRKWKKYILSRGNSAALAPMTHLRGGRGRSRLSSEVDDLVDKVIHNLYLTQERRGYSDVHQQLVCDVKRENEHRTDTNKLRVPSLSCLMRRIKQLPAYEIVAARYGKRSADLHFRHSEPYNRIDAFCSVFEVDHTILDLVIIDPETQLPCARPRLTVIIERRTRAVVGFDIGIDGNSTASVLRCLRHAILPKNYLKTRYPSVHNEWPCFGKPRVLRMDNGREFHSIDLEATCLELAIDLEYCAARAPWRKGVVERFFRTVSKDFASVLPGATSSHFYDRPTGEEPADRAVITLSKVNELFHRWVVDIYMQSRHSTIGQSPHQAWTEQFRLHALELPETPEHVELACMQTEVRKLQHYGVDIFGCSSFNHPCFANIRRRHQFDKTINVRVKYDSASLAHVYVCDPDTNEWIQVVNSDAETTGLSTFQMEAVNKLIYQRKKEGFQLSVVAAKQALFEEGRALRAAKTQAQRKRGMRKLGFKDAGPTPTNAPTPRDVSAKRLPPPPSNSPPGNPGQPSPQVPPIDTSGVPAVPDFPIYDSEVRLSTNRNKDDDNNFQ